MQEGDRKEILKELKEMSKDKPEDKKEFVKWFSELNKNSKELAGEKGANLAEIYNLKLETPPGFVVTSHAYDFFIESAKLEEEIIGILKEVDLENIKGIEEKSEKIQSLIMKAEMPRDLEEEILESYEHLDAHNLDLTNKSALDILNNAAEPIFVAVRSSIITKSLTEKVFPGQNESFTNVKGKKELILHVKRCFASLFSPRSIIQLRSQDILSPKIAVVIQKMVDAEKSGVIFSKNPVSSEQNALIEAIFGMGEGISLGKVKPDVYKIGIDEKIISQEISDKRIAITRNSAGEKIVAKLQESKSNSQVLQNNEIRKINDIALKLEAHFKEPQYIEFAIEKEDLFVLQTRALKQVENLEEQEIKDIPIMSGVAAFGGISFGRIRIINKVEDILKVKEKEILVMKNPYPQIMKIMNKISGIITEEGSFASNVIISSRELQVPCIINLKDATEKLREGEVITMNGFDGKVYKGKVAQTAFEEIESIDNSTRTKLKLIIDTPRFAQKAARTNIKQAGLVRLERMIAESKTHPHYFLEQGKIKEYESVISQGLRTIAESFEEIWVRTSDIQTDEMQNLKGSPKESEINPLLGMHGIRYGLKYPQILKAELSAIKQIGNSDKVVGVLLPNVISIEEIKRVKQIIKEIDFKELRVGVIIETPASIQIIKDICEQGVDTILFNVENLAQYILAVDKENPDLKDMYNKMHPAILSQIEYAVRVCKRYNIKVDVNNTDKELVKLLVKRDINCINVEAEDARILSDYLKELEKLPIEEQPRQYQPEEKVEE